jgi:hypothetical protein
MTVLFSDDFSAADGDLSAPWYYRTDGYHGQRVSGVLTDTNNNGGISFIDAPQDDLDLTVDMTFPASVGSYMDVQIGWKGAHITGTFYPASTAYFLFATNIANAGPTCSVFYYDASGGRTTLFNGGTFVAGMTYTVRIVHVGIHLRVYIDGVLLYQGTTVDLPTQDTIVLLMNNVGGSQPSFDNFSIGDLVVPLPFVDDFTRADSLDLGPEWQAVLGAPYKIVSDVAIQNGGAPLPWYAPVTACISVVDTGVTDHSVEIVTTSTYANSASPVLRYQDDTNFITLDSEQDHAVVELIANVSHTRMTVASAPGDTLKLTALGTTIEVFVNGVSQGTFTTTLTGTQTGVYGYDSNGAGLTSEMAHFAADAMSTTITVDLETFHEIEVFYGAGPDDLETMHEIEVFYGLLPPVPIVLDLETFHEIEVFYGLSPSYGAPIVLDLLTLHEVEMFFPKVRVAFAFNSPRTKMIETAFGFELGTTAFRRWKFHDYLTGETYFFEMNPNSMSTPFLSQQTTSLGRSPISGATAATRVVQPPIDWSFSGNIRTVSFQAALQYWFEKSNKVTLTDHLGRRWIVMPKSFGPYPRPNRKSAQHRWRYDAVVTCYGRG